MKSKVIALIGAPACGKTTLSLNLVTQLKIQDKNAKYILEYPRDYIERFGHPAHISEQMLIFLNWSRLLNQALDIEYEYVICDSPVFVSFIYGVSKSNIKSKKDRLWVLELLDMCLESVKMYDKVFYIKPGKDFTYQDNLRKSDRSTQAAIDRSIVGFLNLYDIPYEEVINKDLQTSTDHILQRIN